MTTKFYSYYKRHNYLPSLVLLAGMLVLLSAIGWLLAGPSGVTWLLLIGIFILISAPRLSPRFVLGLHRAQLIPPDAAPRLYEIISWLANRAEIKDIPALYYIPSKVINAFTTGLDKNTAIALSDGMLRQLNLRELTGVLAHEISHIHNKDLLVMLIADVLSRLTSVMALTGYFLIWIYIPLFILMNVTVPWALLIILMLAPSLSVLMQLALSRSHEFSADTEAAKLTNDPLALASALEKIEHSQGGWIESLFTPSHRMYEPALLRTHPLMIDRVKRLKELASQMHVPAHPFDYREEDVWGQLPSSQQNRRRNFHGLWQ